jgi:hypothetical protein
MPDSPAATYRLTFDFRGSGDETAVDGGADPIFLKPVPEHGRMK